MANARVTVDRSRGNFPKRNGQNQRRTESKRLQHRLPMLWKTKHEDNWPESAFRRSDITHMYTCLPTQYFPATSSTFSALKFTELCVPSFLSRARCESVAAFTRFDHQSHGSRYKAKKTRKLATILPNHSSSTEQSWTTHGTVFKNVFPIMYIIFLPL